LFKPNPSGLEGSSGNLSVQCLGKNGSKAELRNNIVIFFVIHSQVCSYFFSFLAKKEKTYTKKEKKQKLTEKKENFFFLGRKSDCFTQEKRNPKS